MSRRLLLGSEAIAHAALTAGASVVAGYPVEPIAHLVEAAMRQVRKGDAGSAKAEWSVDPRSALGICAATSASGLRSLAAFNQEGFASVLESVAALGTMDGTGGLVLVVVDDRSHDSSPACMDSRQLAASARIPVIDPATPAQAYVAIAPSFELSERYRTPVVVRVTPEVCQTSSFFDVTGNTDPLPPRKQPGRHGSFDGAGHGRDASDSDNGWIFDAQSVRDSQPVIARRLKEISHKFSYDEDFATYNRTYEFAQQEPASRGKHRNNPRNSLNMVPSRSRYTFSVNNSLDDDYLEPLKPIGICACGSTLPYVLEAIDIIHAEARKAKLTTPPIRVYGMCTPFPMPKRAVRRFIDGLSDVLVIEEFSSFTEDSLRKLAGDSFFGPEIHGEGNSAPGQKHRQKPGRRVRPANAAKGISTESIVMRIAAFIDRCTSPESDDDEPLEEGAHGGSRPISIPGLDPGSEPSSHTTSPQYRRTPTFSDVVERAVRPSGFYEYEGDVPDRPPVLCAGCPHRASFFTIKKALSQLGISDRDAIVCGDAGCLSMGTNAPLHMIDASLGAGMGISLAQGFQMANTDAKAKRKCIGIVGDSNFFAEAMPQITNAVVNKHDITIFVLDNSTCAESGLQPSPSTGKKIDIASVLDSLGVSSVRLVDPFERTNAEDACRKAIKESRPTAVVFRSKCARLFVGKRVALINTHKCTGCRKCITEVGCPAITFSKEIRGKKSADRGQAIIDMSQCNGCGLCIQACTFEAIRVMSHDEAREKLALEREKAEKKHARDKEKRKGSVLTLDAETSSALANVEQSASYTTTFNVSTTHIDLSEVDVPDGSASITGQIKPIKLKGDASKPRIRKISNLGDVDPRKESADKAARIEILADAFDETSETKTTSQSGETTKTKDASQPEKPSKGDESLELEGSSEPETTPESANAAFMDFDSLIEGLNAGFKIPSEEEVSAISAGTESDDNSAAPAVSAVPEFDGDRTAPSSSAGDHADGGETAPASSADSETSEDTTPVGKAPAPKKNAKLRQSKPFEQSSLFAEEEPDEPEESFGEPDEPEDVAI